VVADGKEVVVTLSGVAETISVRETGAVWLVVSLTVATKGKVPVVELVPESTPAEEREIPDGREPDVRLQV